MQRDRKKMQHNKIWRIPKPNTALQEIFSLKLGISGVIAQVMINRGITTLDEAKSFLNTDQVYMNDPMLMKDMGIAVDRILLAVKKGERIRVFGDYDVDGITSTSILVRTLQVTGAKVDYYIPERLTEGYGLNKDAVVKAQAEGIALIVTVDCGISAVEEVDLACSLGVDVIITDHHEPPDLLPRAKAIINPKQLECPYPFKGLAGAGVAFKLGQALMGRVNKEMPAENLELACLGTIADIVPLKGENRILVKHGLKALSCSQTAGIRALMDCCGLAGSGLDSRKVAFQLAPRINAAGRLGNANIGVQLLLSIDSDEAASLAARLCSLNEERQSVEAAIYKDAIQLIDERGAAFADQKVIVLAREGWHLGVIGIVASKLVQDYYRPVVLLCINGDKAKGSARSISSFNIYEAFKHSGEYLEKFGGHSQAAGLTLPAENIDAFARVINNYAVEKLTDADLVPELYIDAEVNFDTVNESLIEQIKMLEPFGSENPSPVLACRNSLIVEYKTVGSTGSHLKMRVSENNYHLDAIAFNLGNRQESIKHDEKFDLVFSVEQNEWRGRRTVQLNVQDFKSAFCTDNPFEQESIEDEGFIDSLFKNALTFITDDFYRNVGEKDEFYTKVAGVTFDNRQDVIYRLSEGERLTLLREPENRYDTNAVKVQTIKGNQVGYLNARLSKHFAPLLDRGEQYQVFVSQVTGGNEKNYGLNIVLSKLGKHNSAEYLKILAENRAKLSELPDQELLEKIREALLGGNPYREKQLEAIDHLFKGANTLAVFGTGRGKSAVFQTVAAFKALRAKEMTIIIYPLRALVNDQFESMSSRLEQLGLRVFRGNGSISAIERASLFEAIEKGQIDILLTTPEFVTHHLAKIRRMPIQPGLFVVDESHHIGMSSQSHRPIYKKLGDIVSSLGGPVTLAVTATANDDVADEIIGTLNINKIVIDPHIRANLQLIDKRDSTDKTRYLKQVVSSGDKTIIYVNSRLQTVELAAMLREEVPALKDQVIYYHAGLSNEQRNAIERMFRSGEVTTVVSTSAFGEGIDIPDVKNVVVFHLNFNFTEFNQQCGRCGRNGETARIHLICNRRDAGINQFILEASCPDRDTLAKLYVILKEQSLKEMSITLSNEELAKLLKKAGLRSARPNLVSNGIGILEELGLVQREVMGRNRQIFLLPSAGKINLEKSLRFLEGQEEMKVFNDFQDYFFNASAQDLLNLVNRPIYPAKYFDLKMDSDALGC